MDNFVETVLLPEYNRGNRRAPHPAYQKIEYAIQRARRHGDRDATRELRKQRRRHPSQDPCDPDYRRLRYVRYADAQHNDTKITRGRRAVNGAIGLRVPKDAIESKCALYMQRGQPAQRPQMLYDDDFTIVGKYGAEYRGYVQYYLLAADVYKLGKLRWVTETSMLKTLAGKHRSSVTQMARKYKAKTTTPYGPRTCFEVVVHRNGGKKPLSARFGGIPLHRQHTAILNDHAPYLSTAKGNELIHRLLAGGCEICKATADIEVHHIRKLADLNKPGRRARPTWVRLMAMRRRKTLVVCRTCHEAIHAGRSTAASTE